MNLFTAEHCPVNLRKPLSLLCLGAAVFSFTACGSDSSAVPASTGGAEAASYPNLKNASYIINASEDQAVTYSYTYSENGLLTEFMIATIDKTGEALEGTYEDENAYFYYYEYEMDDHGYPTLITLTDTDGEVSTVSIANQYKKDTLVSAKVTTGEEGAGELLLGDVFLRAELYSDCTITTDGGASYQFADGYLYYSKAANGDETTYNARHDEVTDSFGTYEYDENGLSVKYVPNSSDGEEKTATELTYTKSYDNDRQMDCYSVDFDGGWSKYYINSDQMVEYVETYSTENECYISVAKYEFY